MVIIWDFEKRTMVTKHEVHKVRVESITFSRGDRFVVSLGGRDCGNVVVWDVLGQEAVCGSIASPGTAGDATTICATERYFLLSVFEEISTSKTHKQKEIRTFDLVNFLTVFFLSINSVSLKKI